MIPFDPSPDGLARALLSLPEHLQNTVHAGCDPASTPLLPKLLAQLQGAPLDDDPLDPRRDDPLDPLRDDV